MNKNMLTAITHTPSPFLNQAELTFLSRQPVDADNAMLQHKSYCDMLHKCGVNVITLDKNSSLPDSVFVEDTALVLDEIGIMMPMGAASREEETKVVETKLADFRTIKYIKRPAKLEGGDILQIGRRLYVGLTSRTNIEGIKVLEEIVRPHGYDVRSVNVHGCLHLKTGCTALDDRTILINPDWVDPKPFENFHQVAVPSEEPFAANILRITHMICMHSGFEKTRQKIEKLGYKVEVTDISEFLKTEAGMTCISLIFGNLSE